LRAVGPECGLFDCRRVHLIAYQGVKIIPDQWLPIHDTDYCSYSHM
jgi:hypothetical protein